MTSCQLLSISFAVATAEAVAATLAACVLAYRYAWWRARAAHLCRLLAAEREANLLSGHHSSRRDRADQETTASGG